MENKQTDSLLRLAGLVDHVDLWRTECIDECRLIIQPIERESLRLDAKFAKLKGDYVSTQQ